MVRLFFLLCAHSALTASAFAPWTMGHRQSSLLFGANKHGDGENKEPVVEKKAFIEGTLVEFQEKKRTHIGKILSVERKSNGGARYDVEDHQTGKHFSIADKEVTFSVPAQTNDKVADKVLEQLEHAQELMDAQLFEELDLSPELLEMAWEEVASDEADSHELTSKSLVELVHSHPANHVENYMAWRMLKSDVGHVYFKEIKENGRVVAFKAKAPSAVEASKETFCNTHDNDELSNLLP